MMQALIFDLDGTLIDTVYAHVFAWQRAFAEVGLAIDGWRIHRRIGMSGGLAARAPPASSGREITEAEEQALLKRHGELFRQFLPERRPLPGAPSCCAPCARSKIRYGIATSGSRPEIDLSLEALGIGSETVVIERRDVKRETRTRPVPGVPGEARRAGRRVLRRSAMRSGTCWRRGAPTC